MNSELIHQLETIRKRKGVTQTELAQKLGLPQSSIARVESGKVDTRLSRFVELARALDYEVVLMPKESVQTLQALLKILPDTQLDPSETPAYGNSLTNLFDDSEEEEV